MPDINGAATQDIIKKETRVSPDPLNPFGGLTKQQVQRLALTKGASYDDIEKIGKMYDLVASDGGIE